MSPELQLFIELLGVGLIAHMAASKLSTGLARLEAVVQAMGDRLDDHKGRLDDHADKHEEHAKDIVRIKSITGIAGTPEAAA